MHGISRALADSAVGPITSTPQSFVKIDGFDVAVKGAQVGAHGGPPHDTASFTTGSSLMRINSLEVVIQGTSATCTDQATGSTFVLLSN